MTVIVAVRGKDRVVMGGDSLTASRWSKSTTLEPKVFAVGDLLIGACGSHRLPQLLRYGKHQNRGLADLTPPESSEDPAQGVAWMITDFVPFLRDIFSSGHFVQAKDGLESFGDGCFLVAFGNYLFTVYNNFQISQHAEDYHAVGVGEQFALGSLHTTHLQGPSCVEETDSEHVSGPYCRVELALHSAAQNSPYVAEPFTILSTEKSEA